MSTHSSSTRTDAGPLRRAATRLRSPAERVGFWGAILIPVSYPLLLVSGPGGSRGAVLFAALVVANVAALLAGHGHNRED
ncbi:hypothetical protein [Halosegnis marinus]|uniref:Uncharacterized protein n=1 Tax=Halosegnis marinus TaxID=3034023 RepID=A0ABD5ZLY5_9EURY|nr:hypothetical protein [Halosegnis sp. DT85]